MTAEKILLRTDAKTVSEKIQANRNGMNALNMMIDYFKGSELEVPNLSFLKRLIETELNDEVVNEYVQELYTDQPRKIRDDLQLDTAETILGFTIGRTERNYEFIETKKGKAFLKENMESILKERFSVFATEPKQIDCYNRLQSLVNELNLLGEELHEANKCNAFFTPVSLISPTELGKWAIDWKLNF